MFPCLLAGGHAPGAAGVSRMPAADAGHAVVARPGVGGAASQRIGRLTEYCQNSQGVVPPKQVTAPQAFACKYPCNSRKLNTLVVPFSCCMHKRGICRKALLAPSEFGGTGLISAGRSSGTVAVP